MKVLLFFSAFAAALIATGCASDHHHHHRREGHFPRDYHQRRHEGQRQEAYYAVPGQPPIAYPAPHGHR